MKKARVLHKIVSFVDRDELDFLDRICKDIYFSKKIKVPRAAVLREFIDILMENGKHEIKSYQDLLDVIVEKYEGKGA